MFRDLLSKKFGDTNTREVRNSLEFYVRKWDEEDHESKEFVKIYEKDSHGKFAECDVKNVQIGCPVFLQLPDGCCIQTSNVEKVESAEDGKIIIRTKSREYYC